MATIEAEQPGLRVMAGRPLVQGAVLALLALVLRWSSFGDPDITADETFYQTVGIAMHHGALPYVDVWDRKPLGLFLVYWAITGISAAPLAYQLAATASAAGTALVIARIAMRWTGTRGALLAGALYLVWLTPLFGFGGQSPVFYNLLVAGAALLVLRAQPRLERGGNSPAASLAMVLAGCAITIKTSALFEGAYFGLVLIAATRRSPEPLAWLMARAARWAMLGAAPTLLIALYYAAVGHWGEWWHAMVIANLAKGGDWASSSLRLVLLWRLIMPMVLAAAIGLALLPRQSRSFPAGWLLAALIGLAAIPNFYPHYALPLLVVLCACAAPLLGRGWLGIGIALALAGLSLRAETPFRPGQAERSARTFAELAQAIRAHGGTPRTRGLLVYAGPAQLYPLTGNALPTPLAFETHLSQASERNVSHLDTVAELRRVLAARPGTVVVPVVVRNGPVVPETWAMVNRYVHAHCRPVMQRHVEDWLLADDLVVWGDCRG
ncbi:hypothetical protein ACFOD9_03600 [Novosphingobium bradum]|uniref:Glycosyltransferase RgtA/B/C/D-like domain-containing protein n=1 Tax=Novosphingobium bradum TaxID=1737444 RepID=A0ABV7IMW2_9SPHN